MIGLWAWVDGKDAGTQASSFVSTHLIAVYLQRLAQQTHLRLRDLLQLRHEALLVGVVVKEVLAEEQLVVGDPAADGCVHDAAQQTCGCIR